MKFKIFNKSDLDLSKIKPFLTSFLPFARKKMGFDRPPSISFLSDRENGSKILGKTAFYDSNNDSVVIYTNERHPKDMLRSISHELVHHTQNCKGNFDKKPEMGEGYFQNDQYMREMEREAYELGNMCFREWEETHKKQLEESIYYNTGDIKMKLNEWKNQTLFGRLMENYGYKAPETAEEADDTLEEADNALGEGEEVVEEAEDLEEGGLANRKGDPRQRRPEASPIREEEELEEGAEEGLPASMQRVLAQFAEEDVLDYLMSRKQPTGQAAMSTGLPGSRRPKPASYTPTGIAEELAESKIREAVRKAIKKVLNK